MTAQDKKRRLVGVIQIAISGFSFGFLGVFGKLAFHHSLSVGELLSYRFLTAALLMAAGLGLFSPRRLRITLPDLYTCAGLGIFGYAVFSTFYFAAIKGVSVAMASLLLYTYPMLVAVGARLFFGTRLTRAQLLALPLAFLGLIVLLAGDYLAACASLSGAGPGAISDVPTALTLTMSPSAAGLAVAETSRWLAIASGLAAAVCYAGYILVSSKYQRSIDPLTSGFYVMLFAAFGLFSFHQPGLSSKTPAQLAIILGIAIVCTVTPLVLFLSGLQKLGNTEASLLSTIEPVTAAAVGSLVLGENLTWTVWLGGAMVICALIATVLGGSRPSPAKALE